MGPEAGIGEVLPFAHTTGHAEDRSGVDPVALDAEVAVSVVDEGREVPPIGFGVAQQPGRRNQRRCILEQEALGGEAVDGRVLGRVAP